MSWTETLGADARTEQPLSSHRTDNIVRLLIITKTRRNILCLFSHCLCRSRFFCACWPYVEFRRLVEQVNRSCAHQWIVRLGSALSVLRPCGCVGWPLYSCFRRITHYDRRSLPLSEDRVGHCNSYPTFYVSHLSAVEPCQLFALAQRSLVPVCTCSRAQRHGVPRSPERYRFGAFLGGLLRSVQAQAPLLSATVAAMSTPFRSPIPLPKRAPPQRASEPARGSVPPGLCDPCWKRSAVLCLLDFSSPCRPGPWGRGGAGTSASYLAEPTFISISQGQSGSAVSSRRCSYGRSVSLADSVAEACTATRVLCSAAALPSVRSLIAASSVDKASTPPASSNVVPPVGNGRTARDRGRRTARARQKRQKRASLERSTWKDN